MSKIRIGNTHELFFLIIALFISHNGLSATSDKEIASSFLIPMHKNETLFQEHFKRGYLEISPSNFMLIREEQTPRLEELKDFTGGVKIRNWPVSDFQEVVDLLEPFHSISYVSFQMVWDKDISIASLLRKSVHSFKKLEWLDIKGCQLNNTDLEKILGVLLVPEGLKILDIHNNDALTEEGISFSIKNLPTLRLLRKDEQNEEKEYESFCLRMGQDIRLEFSFLLTGFINLAPTVAHLSLEENQLIERWTEESRRGDAAATAKLGWIFLDSKWGKNIELAERFLMQDASKNPLSDMLLSFMPTMDTMNRITLLRKSLAYLQEPFSSYGKMMYVFLENEGTDQKEVYKIIEREAQAGYYYAYFMLGLYYLKTT